MGAIADRAKQIIPVSWDALSIDSRYGPTALQGRVDAAKYEVLGPSAPLENLESTLDPYVQEYLAKVSVLKIIPAAMEFWMDKPTVITTTGTSEVTSYESRIDELKNLQQSLMAEIAEMQPDIDAVIVPVIRRRATTPQVSDGGGDNLITTDPFTFPAEWGVAST